MNRRADVIRPRLEQCCQTPSYSHGRQHTGKSVARQDLNKTSEGVFQRCSCKDDVFWVWVSLRRWAELPLPVH